MSHYPNVLPLNYIPNSWRKKKKRKNRKKNDEEKKQKKQFKFAVSL